MDTTLYLWDLANTLFIERWNKEKSGVNNYDAYLQSVGYDLKTITPRQYELGYEYTYRAELFDLILADGFTDALSWTRHNAYFTTGIHEQVTWRANKFLQTYHVDVREYLTRGYSTFDFAETNVKTQDMLMTILRKEKQRGFETTVYTDDNEANCLFFISAVKRLTDDKFPLTTRVYRICHDGGGVRDSHKGFITIGNLNDLRQHEAPFR